MKESNVRTIPVGDTFALVDEQDYNLVSSYRWTLRKTPHNSYATTKINGRVVSMHQLIMGKMLGLVIDHKNMDGIDNRHSNLRHATYQENNMNRQSHVKQYKGVWWDKVKMRWRAQIRKDGKKYLLGTFNDPKEAALAYDRKAIELFGSFARLNFPKEAA